MRPVDLSDEALALDLVDELGPEGSYLEADHTIRHFRERWYPSLIERAGRAAWVAKGSRTLAERAAARVDELLAVHKPPPLPDAVSAQIDEILARAAADAGLSRSTADPLPDLPSPTQSPLGRSTNRERGAVHRDAPVGHRRRPGHGTRLAEQALADGVRPLDAIEQGFVPGLTYVGEQFGEGELFLPDMMLAARAMQKAVAVLEPEMAAQSTSRTVAGRVVIGTVKGDIHEIGKNLVGMMLSTSGSRSTTWAST